MATATVFPRTILSLARAIKCTPGGVHIDKLPGNEREIQISMTKNNLRTDLYAELRREQDKLNPCPSWKNSE